MLNEAFGVSVARDVVWGTYGGYGVIAALGSVESSEAVQIRLATPIKKTYRGRASVSFFIPFLLEKL